MKILVITLSLLLFPLVQLYPKEVTNVQLENGLKVFLNQNSSKPIVSVQIWVKAGSINEDKDTDGLSHFLEHLIFKGSDKFPGPEISKRVETNGGSINAATSKEFTMYYIDAQKAALFESIEILADCMANASFPKDEIEKERPVILEEIARHNDNPGSILFDIACESLFKKTPYKKNILGSEKVIKKVSRKRIIEYYKKYYCPANMILSITGDFDTVDTIKKIKDTFGMQKPCNHKYTELKLLEKLHKPVVKRKPKNVEHSYFMGGFIGPDISKDKLQYTADVLAFILGGGRSSRLYRILKEEKRLVYSIGASYWTQRGSGSMIFSSIFDPQNEKAFIDGLNTELNRLMDEGPGDDEIKRAKQVIKSHWYFENETCHARAGDTAYWNLQGNPELYKNYISGTSKVTKEDIVDFLNEFYKNQGLSYSIVYPDKI